MQQGSPTTKIKQVPCPTCKKLSDLTPDNRYRPFCSERCKLTDLGEWASESYAIPDKTPSIDSNDLN